MRLLMPWSRPFDEAFRLETFSLPGHIQGMTETQVNLVQVTPDDRRRRVWLAAAPRDEAVSLVLDTLPEGWSAVLLPLRSINASRLKMLPGEVRELAG